MSTLSQSERQALVDVFSAIETTETPLSKFKNYIHECFCIVKYLLKEKTRTKFSLR